MRQSLSPTSRFDAVDRYVERELVHAGRVAGAQLAIQHHGELHEAHFGYLDREQTRPMRTDALFRIFSMTKPITSVAFMMLVEAGCVALNDPVSRFIPSWSGLAAPGMLDGRAMRIVDLLTHCSGLTYGLQYRTEIDAAYRKRIGMDAGAQSLEEFVAVLGTLPLEFEPGTAWNYSVASDVLGYLIEKISGESLRDFFKRRIFEPLGMTDTDFSVPVASRDRVAECYVNRAEERLANVRPSFEADLTAMPTFFSGGGGLLSSLKDYLAFCNAILDQGRGGDARLLTPETWELMSTNHLPDGQDLPGAAQGIFSDSSYAGVGFGLGWATTLDASTSALRGNPGDTFWSGMANTFFWCDPQEQLIGVFMTQILPAETYPIQREVRRLTYEAIETVYS
jgi:CubicO group peptidase (beta-lactamase class C family)